MASWLGAKVRAHAKENASATTNVLSLVHAGDSAGSQKNQSYTLFPLLFLFMRSCICITYRRQFIKRMHVNSVNFILRKPHVKLCFLLVEFFFSENHNAVVLESSHFHCRVYTVIMPFNLI